MLSALAVAGYRSLRDLVVPLGPLTLVTGPNGSGKSSLYRGLRLLADAAEGRLVASLAAEGGLPSTVWAGPEEITARMRRREVPVQGGPRREPVALKLGFASEELSYTVELGHPIPGRTAFNLDPEIKRECVWAGPLLRPGAVLVDRRGPVVSAGHGRNAEVVATGVVAWESLMTRCGDARSTPEVVSLRDRIRSWRFYDHFRTDRDAPARQARIGTRTVALGHDGVAALLSPRPAELLVLNEPETSLHPDLLPALARLIVQAANKSQVVVVAHAPALVAALRADRACDTIALEKDMGETRVVGQGPLDGPPWRWPAR